MHTDRWKQPFLDTILFKCTVHACGFRIFIHIEPVAVILDDVRKSNEQLLKRMSEMEKELSALREEASSVPGGKRKKVAPSKEVRVSCKCATSYFN